MTWILESTVYLSVTAIIILLFKWIFKNKLSAKWHVLIWLLLAVRLVLPSLPESSFSIFNAFDIPAVQENAQEQVRENDTVLPNADYEVNDNPIKIDNTTRPSNADTADVTDIQINHIPKAESFVENEKAENTADTENMVKWVVYSGSFLIFLYFIVIYIVCIRKNAGKPRTNDGETMTILDECKKKVGVKRRVYIVNGGETPMLMGLVKPTIILPCGYTVSEKKDILIHELCHLKSGDIYLLWIAMIVLCLNWYNPIVWICFFTFRRDIEVYCDERVLKYVDSKKDYAALLVKTALKKNSFVAGTTSLQNGEKEVERRVKHIAYFKKPHYVWTIAIALIAVVIGVLCLTNPVAKKQEKAESAEIVQDINENKDEDNKTENEAEIFETHPVGDYSDVYGKDGKVMESSKNFYLEERTDKYYFEVLGNDGDVLYSGSTEKCPVFIHLDGPIYELRTSQGTFAWKSNFFNVEQGTMSELFDRPFYLVNTVIARVNSNDYYDESLTNKTGMHTNIVFFDVSKEHLENIVHSVSADFLNESTSHLIEYIDDTHICVTYYTENGKQENKKVLEVPSLTKEFSLTFNGFTFDCDTTVEEITSFFPTSDRWEEPENYSFIAGSPTAKRISFAYPDHKAPKVRVICIENLETGHSFIERIIVYDEKAVTVSGEESVNYYKEEYGLGTEYDLNVDTPESRTIDLYQKEILAETLRRKENRQTKAPNNSNPESADKSPDSQDNAEIEVEKTQDEQSDIPLKEQEEIPEETTPVSDISDTVTKENTEQIPNEVEVPEPDNEITISYESIW